MIGITLLNTHHAGGAHVRFMAALALAVAVSALFAAPSEPYVCYKPDAGKSISASGADIDPEPIAFTGMSLTFRYDWREMREGQTVVVYRHDGTENGTWTRVSERKEISSTENTITTDKFDPSSATWNAGWFAVVAQNYGGTTILFR